MSEVLHHGACTTSLTRKEIQQSTATLKALAQKYNINLNTVFKWKHRVTVDDKKPGPPSQSESLTRQQEAITITLRKHSQPPIRVCYQPSYL